MVAAFNALVNQVVKRASAHQARHVELVAAREKQRVSRFYSFQRRVVKGVVALVDIDYADVFNVVFSE